MALSCPNINLQEWKDLVTQLGDEDLAYFQWNKNSSEVVVKPGVQELFNSNPELANSVYEALGFNVDLKSSFPKIENVEKFDSTKTGAFFSDIDGVLQLPSNFSSLPKETQDEYLQHEYIHLQIWNKFGKDGFYNNKFSSRLFRIGRELFKKYVDNKTFDDDILEISKTTSRNKDILKDISKSVKNTEEFFTYAFTDADFANLLKEEGYYDEITNWYKENVSKELFPQITPEQKQQAQQLYSQYLDQIFPNSKVKDIVYHGTNTEFVDNFIGSKQDIEGFKRFVNGSSTKLAQRPTLDGDYVTRLRKVAGQWNMSETGFIKTLGSKQELMRDVERQALSGIEVATASNGSFYFKMDGKKINPFKLKTQASRQKQTKTDKRIVGELRNHLMDFLKTLGVNVQEVDISKLDEGNIAEAEVIVKASGVVEKIIRIAKGYERQDTLAEEAAHIIVDMLGENNPQVREMLELITETQLFKDVIEGYSDLYDGDPMMLKKEAVGQMIAAYLTGNDDVKRQVSPTLWDKIVSLFEWLFGKAKTYDETVFRQRLDKVFKPLVDQILEGDTKGLSDENIKQSTTLAQRGEAGVRDVKTRNEQSFSERVVADLKNQIERLNRQRRPGADNSAIRAEITKLRGRLLSYSITPDLGFLLAYAKEDLAQLQALRAKFDEMTPDEKSRFFLFANYYINSWATLGEAVDITDTNIADPAQDDLRKQFTEIVGNASLMQAELLELFKDHYAKINQIEDGGQFNLFGDYANTNFFESQFLNISVSKIPLVRKIYDIVQKANYQAAERTKMAKEEIEAQVTQLKKWAKANGISEKDLWDIFKQKDSKGNWTGNYIHEYDQRYYEERSRKYRERFEYERGTPEYQRAIREYNKWVEQNSNTIIEEAKYQEAYEAAKQHYTDENGNLEEGMLNYWENLYSPHKKGDMRFEFVTILPKAEKWGDARFDKIKNTPQLLEFYNFFTEFLNERKKVLPYADALKKPNYLPEMYRKGMEGGIRLGSLVKGIGNSVLSTFTARIKPSKQRLTEDPQTGMAENTIPLYMLNDSLNPNNKEYDLEQVLKNFAAMSYLYEHREQVEPDVLVLRKLFADIRNPESQMDANGRAPYSSITGRFFENRGETRHSNTLAALDYFIESSLYDRKAVDADASSSLAYETINPKTGKPEVRGFSFTRFVEFLIKWTRRRGMGFNSFAASANLFFGVLSNQIEAAAGTHFTTDQANMAFRKMLGVALGGKLTEEGKKILLLMEKFDVVKDYMDTSSEGTFSPSKFDKLLFIMQEKTENFIYGQTFLAVLFNTKIKDKSGKERHLFDAYEVKDGKLAWKEEFGHEEFEDLSDEKYRLKTKIDRLLEDIHGDYNSLNPKLINKTVLGRAIMVFRNWIPQGVQNRFGSLRYDSRLGTHKKGRLLSYGAYFQKNDRDQRDVGRGIADLLRDTSMELAKQTINSFFLGKKIVNYDTMSQLSELDAANMRKNITALRFTLMLMAVALMIKGLTIDDDDDAQVSAIKFILMSIYRTETDLTFYLNPNSQQQLLRDFVPVAGTIGEITDIFDATAQLIAGNDELQSGPNAGRSRFMREAYQSLPALAQIQRLYELQGINIDSRRGY